MPSEISPVSLRTSIMRSVTTALTSPTRRKLARDAAALSARLRGERATIRYFHQADDPYSHLAVQMLPRLRARYAADIEIRLVPPPADSAAPDRERLRAYGLRDAIRLARSRGLGFPADATLPTTEAVQRLQSVLADALDQGRFDDVAYAAGAALWAGDHKTLADMATRAGGQDPKLAERLLKTGEEQRAKLGHYLGGMFHFEGEWFWGVDRLGHLEARLAARGLDREAGSPLLAPAFEPSLGPPPEGAPPTIEAWFSFRSPYSWLFMPRIRHLAQAYGATLELRPILPMVMRGLAVPRIKTIYITLDCKREAERVDLPFGRIVDPVGAGAERALAVLHHAMALGLGEQFAELGLKAAFADGIALAEDEGLYGVARRAGLTDAQTAAALADDSWRQRAETNRAALLEAGLWGAPTFRITGHQAHWGQDRLYMMEEDLRAAMQGAAAPRQDG
ncbi:2-hydroxychromene-2-carboxylate dehydrogenase [Caulobacter vibrioides]|uniref:DsbA family protein n=1 Tax=Caulobacter vibrioides TaxID=155892 RepID=UPI000BB48546|nr:DsbA family protein [Caulobacter vibrioides]ATC24112.1 2-hydroxychromene-2-carboxylate dehydrogenase [Caulobacter vibrioides]AZH12361.1 2-hydroxychromene-2-carboxylate dehydrogenase [Caulobacter vibrioides]PLR08453.1 2-hydroxychromene-2-carboxylate dehydrogenase [Caulobacter vibrioides]